MRWFVKRAFSDLPYLYLPALSRNLCPRSRIPARAEVFDGGALRLQTLAPCFISEVLETRESTGVVLCIINILSDSYASGPRATLVFTQHSTQDTNV